RTSGDCETFVENAKLLVEAGVQLSRTLLATSGDRLALEHFLWTGDSSGDSGGVEVAQLNINEVDAEGHLVAVIMFDPDDRRAAFREMYARFATGSMTDVGLGAELTEGNNDRDPARMRAVIANDLVVHDHRLAGIGLIEGADAYLESIAALWQLAPD